MRDNWIRNTKGEYFNLDMIKKICVYERFILTKKTFTIIADTWNLEDIEFQSKEEAQAHIDSIMSNRASNPC